MTYFNFLSERNSESKGIKNGYSIGRAATQECFKTKPNLIYNSSTHIWKTKIHTNIRHGLLVLHDAWCTFGFAPSQGRPQRMATLILWKVFTFQISKLCLNWHCLYYDASGIYFEDCLQWEQMFSKVLCETVFWALYTRSLKPHNALKVAWKTNKQNTSQWSCKEGR